MFARHMMGKLDGQGLRSETEKYLLRRFMDIFL